MAMTHDDMERAMEFILQQQVKFGQDLQQHQTAFIADLEKIEASFRRRMDFIVGQQARFAEER
jgi:hypothetical protein